MKQPERRLLRLAWEICAWGVACCPWQETVKPCVSLPPSLAPPPCQGQPETVTELAVQRGSVRGGTEARAWFTVDHKVVSCLCPIGQLCVFAVEVSWSDPGRGVGGRNTVGVDATHPIPVRRAELMVVSTRWVFQLRLLTGAQYSAVECTRASVDVLSVALFCSPLSSCEVSDEKTASCNLSS